MQVIVLVAVSPAEWHESPQEARMPPMPDVTKLREKLESLLGAEVDWQDEAAVDAVLCKLAETQPGALSSLLRESCRLEDKMIAVELGMLQERVGKLELNVSEMKITVAMLLRSKEAITNTPPQGLWPKLKVWWNVTFSSVKTSVDAHLLAQRLNEWMRTNG